MLENTTNVAITYDPQTKLFTAVGCGVNGVPVSETGGTRIQALFNLELKLATLQTAPVVPYVPYTPYPTPIYPWQEPWRNPWGIIFYGTTSGTGTGSGGVGVAGTFPQKDS